MLVKERTSSVNGSTFCCQNNTTVFLSEDFHILISDIIDFIKYFLKKLLNYNVQDLLGLPIKVQRFIGALSLGNSSKSISFEISEIKQLKLSFTAK